MADPDDLKKVQVRCPKCDNPGNIMVSKNVIQSSPRGVTTINIPKDQICKHNFVAYVDKNFAVRDYFVADLSLTDVVADLSQEEKRKIIPQQKKVQVTDSDYSLVRSTLGRKNLGYLLHGIFLNKPMHLIHENSNIKEKTLAVLEEITLKTFDITVSTASLQEYMTNKRNYSGMIVIDVTSEMILEDSEGLFSPKKLSTESEIVNKTFKQTNPTTSLIVLKNEIQKLFSLANIVKQILQEKPLTGPERWAKKDIITELRGRNNIKLNPKQLSYVFEIIQANFNIDPNQYL